MTQQTNREWVLVLAAVFGALPGLRAQTAQAGPVQEMRFQQNVMVLAGPGSQPAMAGSVSSDGHFGLLKVTGKPFSGTEVRRTVQTLGNGTHVENSDSNLFYRDEQGRTRSEQSWGGKTVIAITDPVAGFVAILNPAAKTGRRTPIPADAVRGSVSVSGGGIFMGFTMDRKPGSAKDPGPVYIRRDKGPVRSEDLGALSVSGVMAQGTRETLTIPAGQFGNDRDIQVIDERWFAQDLQMLVKSLNSDPRFGETTYQLTNIVRGAQDPALFQVPSDYTLTEGMH